VFSRFPCSLRGELFQFRAAAGELAEGSLTKNSFLTIAFTMLWRTSKRCSVMSVLCSARLGVVVLGTINGST